MNLLNHLSLELKLLEDHQILVVDNDRDSLSLYAYLLGGYGANVVIAASIEEALETLDWLLPDLVICETRFWEETIDTLTAKLREMGQRTVSRIPTIAVTTWITDRLAQCLHPNFASCLLKPINLDILVFTVEALLLPDKLTSCNEVQD